MSFLNEEDGFDDPLDFNQVQFQKLDEHLRCPICKELLNATMMLNTCSHSFCALCIRRSLNTEQLCPKCRKPAYENNLIHNYDLDNVVHTWKDSRKLFLQMDQLYTQPRSPLNVIQQHNLQQQSNIQQQQSHGQDFINIDDSLYQPATVVIDDDDTDDFAPTNYKKSSQNYTPSRRSTRIKKQVIQNETSQSNDSQADNANINSKLDVLQLDKTQTAQPIITQTQLSHAQLNQPLAGYSPMGHPQTSCHQIGQFQANTSPLQQSNYQSLDSSMNQLYNHSPMNQYQANRPPVNTSQSQNNSHELKTTTMVECPICSQHMKFNVLDRHIDKCLQGDSRIPPEPVQTSTNLLSNFTGSTSSSSAHKMKVPTVLKRSQKPVDLGKKPVKLVYSMLSDKELRDCLRSLNLPEHGDKAQKVWRHKEYINLYNANYDSQYPVSAQVLIQRLQTIENSQATEKANQSKRKVTDVDSHKSKYADHFANLIASAKKSKANK